MDLYERIPVLDHGFVQLLDVMGNDQAIVDAARMSISGKEAKATSNDEQLIRYLYRNRHTTPFEMVVFKFLMKIPIFVARQLVRHRMASINEMSARYSVLPAEFYVPQPEQVNYQSKMNKQGREGGQMDDAEDYVKWFRCSAEEAFEDYSDFIKADMARELARINLPLSTYTQWVWKTDLHNCLNMLSLRDHAHAQWEIQQCVKPIATVVQQVCPLAYQSFLDYRKNAMTLTAHDVAALKKVIGEAMHNCATPLDLLEFPTVRERQEFAEKLKRLGL